MALNFNLYENEEIKDLIFNTALFINVLSWTENENSMQKMKYLHLRIHRVKINIMGLIYLSQIIYYLRIY